MYPCIFYTMPWPHQKLQPNIFPAAGTGFKELWSCCCLLPMERLQATGASNFPYKMEIGWEAVCLVCRVPWSLEKRSKLRSQFGLMEGGKAVQITWCQRWRASWTPSFYWGYRMGMTCFAASLVVSCILALAFHWAHWPQCPGSCSLLTLVWSSTKSPSLLKFLFRCL